MRNVYVVGTGATPVAEHWGRAIDSLVAEASAQALGSVPAVRVGAVFVANALGGALGVQAHLAPFVATAAGLRGVEAHSVEAGSASGGLALRQAYLAIASGAIDAALVIGAEKATDALDGAVEAALALSLDVDWEAVHGATLTSYWALLMRRYMHEYGYTTEDFAPFPVNAHANGAHNRQALYRFPISVEKVRAAGPVSEPLTLLDSSTVADGAAAILLTSEGIARELGGPLLRIAGSAVATDSAALFRRSNPLWFEAAERSAAAALRGAHLSTQDVDVLDVADPHAIAAVLSLEASGFAERGAGVQLGKEGAIQPQGSTPLATGGGCKARGDVVGANGVYQVVELARQLRAEAGQVQVPDAQVAFAQCLGGIGATAATHIIVRDE